MLTTLKQGNSIFRKLQPSLLLNARKNILPFRPCTRNYATPIIKYRPPIQEVNIYRRFPNNQKVPFYKSKRVWVFVGTGTVLFGGYYVTHLERVPISGRARFMDITPRQEEGNFYFFFIQRGQLFH